MGAGKGTRMKDPSKAKVMYEILGKPMIHYVVDLAAELKMDRVIVIVGFQKEIVTAYLKQSHPFAECVVQEEQLGTGHAVAQARETLSGFDGHIVVLSGDVPLLTRGTMEGLIATHVESGADATILTAEIPDPIGYGRIIRAADGSVEKIVEHRDASADEGAVNEINSGIYVFEKVRLFESLEHLKADNVQQEYYLTDVFAYFRNHEWNVAAVKTRLVDEIQGINNVDQLEETRKTMENRRKGSQRVDES
jgi:bifunctional UDP-N-acetylglucosamine pyrophosphorylase/glucosamine-1-phosphate N-acetyltransferase